MLKSLILLCVIWTIVLPTWAQNLKSEKIWKITDRKRSVYQEQGVFHSGVEGTPGVLKSVRHSKNPEIKAERIVFDFEGDKVPRVYGHLAKSKDKIYVDFFSTTMAPKAATPGKGQVLSGIEFYPISKDILSIELSFNSKISADVFYLENPGRLVIDVKN